MNPILSTQCVKKQQQQQQQQQQQDKYPCHESSWESQRSAGNPTGEVKR